MTVYFCLSLIFWIRYCHIRNFRSIERLYFLINIMFILTYVCFLIFLSIYCNVMLATIKKWGKMKIKLYLTLKWNKIWDLTNWSNENLLIFWSNKNLWVLLGAPSILEKYQNYPYLVFHFRISLIRKLIRKSLPDQLDP